MSKLFDRAFISGQHARRSPLPAGHDFLFKHVEADAQARLAFLKDMPRRAAIQGRRPSADIAACFEHSHRFKLNAQDESLEFFDAPNQSVDLVLTLLSLHAANDVTGVLKHMRDALAPRGVLLACVFGQNTLVTLRQALAAAESEIYGSAGARVYPFADGAAWAGQLQNAGYKLPVSDSELLTVHYRSLNALLTDIRMMGEANGMTQRPRRPLFPHVVKRAEEIYRDIAPSEDGLLEATFDLTWMMGFKD